MQGVGRNFVVPSHLPPAVGPTALRAWGVPQVSKARPGAPRQLWMVRCGPPAGLPSSALSQVPKCEAPGPPAIGFPLQQLENRSTAALRLPCPHSQRLSSCSSSYARPSLCRVSSSGRPSWFPFSRRALCLWPRSLFRAPRPSYPVLRRCPGSGWTVDSIQEPVHTPERLQEITPIAAILFSYTGRLLFRQPGWLCASEITRGYPSAGGPPIPAHEVGAPSLTQFYRGKGGIRNSSADCFHSASRLCAKPSDSISTIPISPFA